MTPTPACPVCGADHWEVVGWKTFSRASLASASEVVRARLQVLFELWAAGEQRIRIEYVLCQRCAMVVYRPRPTEAEVDAKYRFLHGLSGQPYRTNALSAVERQRARELFQVVKPHLAQGRARVLDFGGYRGALMADIAGFGCDCSVVDYAPDALPGVTRLGDTLVDLVADQRFDLIVCSHVLEHVVEPLAVCKQLAGHLPVGGLLFVEVPLEILGHSPRPREPVTHLNFFSKESLDALLQLAGLSVESCQETACTVGNGRCTLVVRALARRRAEAVAPVSFEQRAASVRKLLQANRLQRWLWRIRHPRLLLALPVQLKNGVSSLGRRAALYRASRQQ